MCMWVMLLCCDISVIVVEFIMVFSDRLYGVRVCLVLVYRWEVLVMVLVKFSVCRLVRVVSWSDWVVFIVIVVVCLVCLLFS